MPHAGSSFRAAPLALRVPLGAVALAVLAYLLGVGFGPLDDFMARWAPLVLELGGALACALRAALVEEERLAWSLIAAGALSWALGDTVWRIAYHAQAQPLTPSLSDPLRFCFYPFAVAGIALLIRDRAHRVSAVVWIDGLIAALAAGAVATALAYNAVLEQDGGASQATAINVGYVLADAILLGLILVAFAIDGWRLDRAWAWLGGALAVFAISDSAYVYEVATGTSVGGGLLDAGWGLALLLLGIAAWHTGPRRRADAQEETWQSIAPPIAFGVLALGVEVYDHFNPVTPLTLVLASTCLAAVLLRLAMTFGLYLAMLRTARAQARTDALTGLGNRRCLLDDLERSLEEATSGDPLLLLLLDLDGFKAFNDRFGHPAGDTLLTRLAKCLSERLLPWGRAYRLGGDEFCALLTPSDTDPEVLAAIAAAALREPGEPGSNGIEASVGWALLPVEARSASDALRLADRRMYGDKGAARRGDRRWESRARRTQRRTPHSSA